MKPPDEYFKLSALNKTNDVICFVRCLKAYVVQLLSPYGLCKWNVLNAVYGIMCYDKHM